MEPVQALRDIAFQLERAGAPTYRVRAFRRAAQVAGDLPAGELDRRIRQGTLQELAGIGATTAEVITQAAGGGQPAYLTALLAEAAPPQPTAMRSALRGDCHTHSDWSDCNLSDNRCFICLMIVPADHVDAAVGRVPVGGKVVQLLALNYDRHGLAADLQYEDLARSHARKLTRKTASPGSRAVPQSASPSGRVGIADLAFGELLFEKPLHSVKFMVSWPSQRVIGLARHRREICSLPTLRSSRRSVRRWSRRTDRPVLRGQVREGFADVLGLPLGTPERLAVSA